MTTIWAEEKTCAICGQTSRQTIITSTNLHGAPDLDLRPPEKQRSTIIYWVQSCPSCGYCAPRISEGLEIAPRVIQSDGYQRQLKEDSYPALANRFLCRTIIQEAAGDCLKAGWAAVHAAWVCDDAEEAQAAHRCRKRALGLFEKARASGIPLVKEPGQEEIIVADLLRRSGQFDKAIEVCEEALTKAPAEGILRQLLRFQQTLARKKDMESHTTHEAKGGPPGSLQ